MRHIKVVLATLVPCAAFAGSPSAPPLASLEVLGTYRTGLFEQAAAEIVAYDPRTRRVFVVNAASTTIDVLDIRNPAVPTLVSTIDAGALGGDANSVAVKNGLVAVAIQAEIKTDPGLVAIYDSRSLALLATFPAGALPDMVAFSPDGKIILVANEGEPNPDYSVDPEGSITRIDLSRGLAKAKVTQLDFTRWNQWREKYLARGVRLFGPNASVAQDLEPEYIAFSKNGRFAYVTLQENNAIAVVDVRAGVITEILPLGTKDHSLPGNAFDASDRDGGINIANWPVKGLYLPDAIASFTAHGKTYLVTANEGDARDYAGFAEEARVKDLQLDPVAFPNAADLRRDAAIGRLNVTRTLGDVDNDGDYDELYSFGARSFSIWTTYGAQVFDSGSELEDLVAALQPDNFNSDHVANGSADSRSDNKGPEPEGLAVGTHRGRTYLFVGLERQSGIVVYDVTEPSAPLFQDFMSNRDFSVPTTLADGSVNPLAGDLGPEGLTFIAAADSPTRKPLLVVGNEVSGTTTIYELKISY